MRTDIHRAYWIIGFCLVVIGCGSTIRHQYELAPGKAFGGNASRVLLVPINETDPVPTGLEVGEENVFKQLQSYLKSKGLSVETRDPYMYRVAAHKAATDAHNEMLSAQTGAISGDIDFAAIVPGLLANLESDADLVVVSNMVIRTGESDKSRTTRWDGVKRHIAMPKRMRMTGTESVASVFVAVYERDGSRVFSGYGGLDLLFAPNIREEKYELIPDRLQDLENIREGVCVAFYPYFGPEEICR